MDTRIIPHHVQYYIIDCTITNKCPYSKVMDEVTDPKSYLNVLISVCTNWLEYITKKYILKLDTVYSKSHPFGNNGGSKLYKYIKKLKIEYNNFLLLSSQQLSNNNNNDQIAIPFQNLTELEIINLKEDQSSKHTEQNGKDVIEYINRIPSLKSIKLLGVEFPSLESLVSDCTSIATHQLESIHFIENTKEMNDVRKQDNLLQWIKYLNQFNDQQATNNNHNNNTLINGLKSIKIGMSTSYRKSENTLVKDFSQYVTSFFQTVQTKLAFTLRELIIGDNIYYQESILFHNIEEVQALFQCICGLGQLEKLGLLHLRFNHSDGLFQKYMGLLEKWVESDSSLYNQSLTHFELIIPTDSDEIPLSLIYKSIYNTNNAPGRKWETLKITCESNDDTLEQIENNHYDQPNTSSTLKSLTLNLYHLSLFGDSSHIVNLPKQIETLELVNCVITRDPSHMIDGKDGVPIWIRKTTLEPLYESYNNLELFTKLKSLTLVFSGDMDESFLAGVIHDINKYSSHTLSHLQLKFYNFWNDIIKFNMIKQRLNDIWKFDVVELVEMDAQLQNQLSKKIKLYNSNGLERRRNQEQQELLINPPY